MDEVIGKIMAITILSGFERFPVYMISILQLEADSEIMQYYLFVIYEPDCRGRPAHCKNYTKKVPLLTALCITGTHSSADCTDCLDSTPNRVTHEN